MSSSEEYAVVVAKLTPEDGSGFVAYAPDLPGCMSDGETPEEAFSNGRLAVEEWLDVARRNELPIPAPGSAARRAEEARRQLLQQLEEQQETFARVTADIAELKKRIEAVSEKMDAPESWGLEVKLLSISSKNTMSDIVH